MVTKLEDFLEEVSEKTTQNNQYPVLTSSKNGLFLQDDYFNKQVASKDNTGYKIIKRGEFTYRAMSDTGEFYPNMLECAEIGIVSPAYPVFKISSDIILPDYLKYYFRSNSFQRAITSFVQGSTRASMKFAKMKTISIDLPNKTEQRKTVRKLDLVKKLIEMKTKELSQLDNLAKARFVEMFGGSNKYPMEPLKNSVQEMFIGPFGSALKNECFVDPKDGYCIVYEQKHAIRKTMDVPTRYVNEQKYNELKRFSVFPGDIIVSCRGTIGEIFIVPDGAPLGIMHPSIMKIRLDEDKYDQKFFVFALEQYMQEHNNEAKGSGVKMAVTATTLGKELFVIPRMKTQKQFSNFVEQIYKSKITLQKSLEKTQLLLDSLMQEFFG